MASTREQLHLLHAIDAAGARLIAVGDVRQNSQSARAGSGPASPTPPTEAQARVELTVNQRARDPGDRRDQALREGQAELSIRGYAARDRIHHHAD